MGILMKNGVNYTGYATKNVAMAHYNSVGAIEVYFSEKSGTKVNGAPSGNTRYLTTSTSDPIAFFKRYYAPNNPYYYGFGAISLRPLVSGTDYSTYDVHSGLLLTDTLVVNGITVYVYMETDTWQENYTRVTIDDKFIINDTWAKDSDISANSKFIKDIVATLSDNYILPPEPLVKYSTVEHVVGAWIDNKPIYEKTWLLNSLTLTRNEWTDTDIVLGSQQGDYNLIESTVRDNNYAILVAQVTPWSVGGKVAIYNFRPADMTAVSITLRYTKTTD